MKHMASHFVQKSARELAQSGTHATLQRTTAAASTQGCPTLCRSLRSDLHKVGRAGWEGAQPRRASSTNDDAPPRAKRDGAPRRKAQPNSAAASS